MTKKNQKEGGREKFLWSVKKGGGREENQKLAMVEAMCGEG